MIPREVAEAAEEIRRFEKKDNPDALETIDIQNVKHSSKTVDHVELVNCLVKFISFVRMPVLSKEIMIYKLARPGLTNMDIAMQRGIRVTDVDLYEEEGKRRVKEALESTALQDAIDKFNTERSVEAAVQNLRADDGIVGGTKLE